jgi:hypothetical protein
LWYLSARITRLTGLTNVVPRLAIITVVAIWVWVFSAAVPAVVDELGAVTSGSVSVALSGHCVDCKGRVTAKSVHVRPVREGIGIGPYREIISRR